MDHETYEQILERLVLNRGPEPTGSHLERRVASLESIVQALLERLRDSTKPDTGAIERMNDLLEHESEAMKQGLNEYQIGVNEAANR